jgi:hypothetical protein
MFLDWSIVCCSALLCYYCVQSGMLHLECTCGGAANTAHKFNDADSIKRHKRSLSNNIRGSTT